MTTSNCLALERAAARLGARRSGIMGRVCLDPGELAPLVGEGKTSVGIADTFLHPSRWRQDRNAVPTFMDLSIYAFRGFGEQFKCKSLDLNLFEFINFFIEILSF